MARARRFAGYPLDSFAPGSAEPLFMPTSSVTKRRRRRSAPAPKQAQKLRLIPEIKEPASEHSSSFAKFRLAPAILLTLITLSVYFQVIHLPFTNYDDGEYVQNNPDIQRGVTKATL